MLSKRNNCINKGGGKRKPTFGYTENDVTTTRQVLTLRKKTRRRCEEMKNRKNRKGGRREIKIRGFLRLNSSHKAPFSNQSKMEHHDSKSDRQGSKETTTSLHQWSWSRVPKKLIWRQKVSKESQTTCPKDSQKATYSLLVISHVTCRINSCTQIHPRD